MQIIQFLVGASYASLHSFISYTIPVQVLSNPGATVKAVSSSAASVVAQATATGLAALAEKLLYRAAGEEGLAENVGAPAAAASERVNPHPYHAAAPVYHTEYQTVPCIDTSGETFAIWLNVFYLAPLTVLFVRFFIRAYLRRTGTGKKSGPMDRKAIKGKGHEDEVSAAEGAVKDALKGVGRELDGERPNGNGRIAKELHVNGNGKAKGSNGKAH